MSVTAFSYIQCLFSQIKEEDKHGSNPEVFFAEVKYLDQKMLKKFVSGQETERASLFHSDKDRSTYICCHALLRLVISRRLNIAPDAITFMKEKGNKPYIKDYPLHFNITHTREAFAFVISDRPVGIDLENIHRRLDPETFMNSTFNSAERRFVTTRKEETRERMYLLWTRKEAFLKALGTGIASDLREIKVSGKRNLIGRKVAESLQNKCMINNYFIYSTRILDNYLSIAIPGKVHIRLNMINENNIGSLLLPADLEKRSLPAVY